VSGAEELQRTQNAADIALCEAIKARNEPGIPHEEFMAALGAEDASTSVP